MKQKVLLISWEDASGTTIQYLEGFKELHPVDILDLITDLGGELTSLQASALTALRKLAIKPTPKEGE